MEIPNSEKAPQSEVSLLEQTLNRLGIDVDETEKVVEQAVLLFGEGRPEHEVEAIIEALYKKIDVAGASADELAD